MASAETIQARITVAKRQKETRDAEYDRWIALLTNDWTDGKMKLAPNIVHSSVRQLVSTVIFDNPEFSLRAMQPKYQEASKGVTAYSNWLWSQIEGNEQTELVITDAIVYPIGFWKVGMGRAYNSERQLRDLEEAEMDARAEHDAWLRGEFDTYVEDDDRHATHLPMHHQFYESEEFRMSPYYDLMKEYVEEHIDTHGDRLVAIEPTRSPDTEGSDPDMPFIYRVSPRDIFWDSGHTIFEQSRYVLERARMMYDEWMENPAYRHPEGVQPTDVTDEAKSAFDDQELEITRTERGMGVIDIWHHYDKADGTYSAWVEGYMDPVRPKQPQQYRFMKGYPLEALRIDIVPERMHGPGLVSRLEHPQQMDIDVAHRVGTHARNASTKWVLQKDRLENPENIHQVKSDLQDSEMDVVIEASDPTVLTPLQPAILDPSLLGIRSLLKETVQEAVGLSDPGRGQVTGATATEIREVTGTQGVVLGGIAKKVRKALINLNKKLMAITREFGPDHMVVPVFGTKNDWAQFKRQDLAGDYQVIVQLPLPGDRQAELNNFINAVHEMRASANVKGEGMRRLEMDMIKKMDLEPELYFLDPSADTIQAVTLEHKAFNMLQMVEPQMGEDTTYHIEQHNLMASDLERQLMQIQQITGQSQQMMQQGLQVPPQAQIAMQMAQQMQQVLQILLQHIQMTEQMQPGVPQGRRRNALLFPTGNPGTAESEFSNEVNAGM